MMFRLISRLATTLPVALALALPLSDTAHAQSAFSPAITINDRSVTYYEIEQRALLMSVMGATGDLRKLAREQLIDDRLKLQAAAAAGIAPTEEGITNGVDDFARQTNLPTPEMLKALAQEGIDESTVRAFVASGIIWRGVVQTLYGSKVDISEAEIDRAIAANTGSGSVRVLLSEIVMPATNQTREAVTNTASQFTSITSFAEFEAAARANSAASTKDQGGHIDWMSITNLPPQLRPLISALGTGQVTDPVQLPTAVAVFQLRGIEETGRQAANYSAIDYAMLLFPGGRTAENLEHAREIDIKTDRCDDLYGLARDMPRENLIRETQAPGEIPRDIALELAKMDDNETSTNLTTANGQALIFLMLCSRTADLGQEEEISREQISQVLRTQKLESYADSYLNQLRAEARITEK